MNSPAHIINRAVKRAVSGTSTVFTICSLMAYLGFITYFNICIALIYMRNSNNIHMSLNTALGYGHSKQTVNPTCNLVMRYVKGFGVGMYAGRDLANETSIELSIGILLSIWPLNSSELVNYVEGYNDTHFLLTLGNSLLLNHMPYEDGIMVNKYRILYEDTQELVIDFQTNEPVKQGDQLFISYGESSWFHTRDVEEISPKTLAKNESSIMHVENVQTEWGRIPGCPLQLTRLVEKPYRLVAGEDIRAGQVIEVARAIRIPEYMVSYNPELVPRVWHKYRNTSEGSHVVSSEMSSDEAVGNGDYAILLFGRGAFYGPSGPDTIEPNVFYDWWDVAYLDAVTSEEDSSDSSNSNSVVRLAEDRVDLMALRGDKAVDSLEGADRDSIDEQSGEYIQCSDRMFVIFVAARDIARGEELVVPLTTDDAGLLKFTSEQFSAQCL